MKNPFILLLLLFTLSTYAQTSLTEEAQPIVEEGKLLYRSEMASWYGTDLFLANYETRDHIGGYLSYTENDITKCIFFSKSENPKVIGTISFDDTYNTDTAGIDLQEREFTALEKNLYLIRRNALVTINADRTLFKTYENTNLNLIPIISGNDRKVYVLTGPQKNGVVIFGNDYLLTFDDTNQLKLKKRLHKNIIPINYGEKLKEGQKIEGGIHSHLPETGDFITATDICTLMLYSKFAQWKSYHVVSEKYVNMWNCEKNQLTVLTTKAFKKIDKHIQKKEKQKNKKNKKG